MRVGDLHEKEFLFVDGWKKKHLHTRHDSRFGFFELKYCSTHITIQNKSAGVIY